MFETIESSEEKSQDTDGNSLPNWVPTAGAICDCVFFANILLRMAAGTGRIGLTAYGDRLLQAGMSLDTATALDMGQMSIVMVLCLLLSLVPLLMGIIGLFKRGEKRNAVIAIATGLFLWAFVLLLPLI
jgi:hypothetical protein